MSARLRIVLDPESGVPPYEQVRARVAAAAASGEAPAGTRLLPVRQLADELGLAANTVARAYRELEQAGVVVTRGRAGTVVADTDLVSGRAREATQALVVQLATLGVGVGEAVVLVRAAYAARDPR